VKNPHAGISRDLQLARSLWGPLSRPALVRLKELIGRFGLSVVRGELQYLYEGWYVTHAGLLGLAQRRHCAGIHVQQVREYCEPTVGRWVFKATVYRRRSSKGFVGYGDADPSNVSSLVRGAELRIAETRAVNRALRKAYGIGLCSVEELSSLSGSFSPVREPAAAAKYPSENASNNGQPRLRDKLCLLIRQYNLDPNLVKAYAADFCGTEKLSGASREMVEAFINQLAKSAKENRDSLVCKLNSYAQTREVNS